MGKKFTIEEVSAIFAEHGYTLLAKEYNKIHTKMPFICNKHKDQGVQYCSLATVKYDNGGCKFCGQENRKWKQIDPHEYTKMKACFEEHGLILLDTQYRGVNEWYRCKCAIHPEHGEFKKRYTDVKWQHQGCPKCGYDNLRTSRRYSESYYRDLVESAGYEFISVDFCHRDDGGTYINYICPKHRVHGVQRKKASKFASQGCPFRAESNGELSVRKYLLSHDIDFTTRKTFTGLVGIGGGLLSYDFFLSKYHMLIEYQGIQHEQPIDLFGGEEQLKVQLEHDHRKRTFAIQNGYHFLEIWYYDYDKVVDILDGHLNDLEVAV